MCVIMGAMSRARPPLYLLGAGGLGEETAEAVRAINATSPTWDLMGFLDDDPSRHGSTLAGLPVVGGMDVVSSGPDEAMAIACIARPGRSTARAELVDRLALPDERWATVVHPT